MSFAPMIGDVARDLGIDLGTASFGLLAVTMFVAAAGVGFAGFFIDRAGIFPIVIAGQLLVLLSTAAIPLAGNHFELLIAIRVAQGLGSACLTAAITPAMALWFPPHEMGRAIGLQSIGMPIGMMLGLNATPLFSHALHSWHQGLFALAVVPLLALVVTIPVAIASGRIRNAVSIAELNREVIPASEFLRTPTFWIGLVALCLCYWAGLAFNGLAPGFLAVDPPAGAGYGPQGAGSLMLVFTLSGIVGPPIGGFVVDKLFNGRSKPLIAIGWVIGAVCYTAILLPAVSGNRSMLELVLLIAGLSNPFIDVTLMSFAAKVFPLRVVGRVAGLWLSCALLTGSVSMMVGSLALRTTGTYTLSLLIIGAACVIGFAVASLLTHPRHAQAARPDFSVN